MSLPNYWSSEDGAESNEFQNTHELDFNQAMADFIAMFPEMENAVIEEVLRSNHGAVDATIDQLLILCIDNEKEQLKSKSKNCDETATAELSRKLSSACPAKSASKTLDNTLNGEKPALSVIRGWKRRSVFVSALPRDFLRFDPRFLLLNDRQGTQPHDSFNDNEIPHLTMLLQTPEFIEILKKDTDFMQSLEKEQFARKKNFVSESGDKSSGASEEEDSFNNKLVLTNLGRIPRLKLTQLARTFFNGKKFHLKNSRSILCEEDDDEDRKPSHF